jgi:hypothetical protein
MLRRKQLLDITRLFRLNNILTFPTNIVVCGHWKVTTDQKTGAILSVDPLLTGDLSEKIPGYFDEVYTAVTQMKDGKENYYIRTVTRGFFKARSRVSGPYRLLPDMILNTYPNLLKHMEEGVRKEAEYRERGQAAIDEKLKQKEGEQS